MLTFLFFFFYVEKSSWTLCRCRQQQSSVGLLPTKTPRWPAYACDPAQDPVRARHHIAGGHSFGRLQQLFLRDFPIVRPLHRDCSSAVSTPRQLHDNLTITSRQLHDNLTTTPRQPHDNSTTTSWQLHDNSTTTSWQLHDSTTPRQPHNSSATTPQLISND